MKILRSVTRRGFSVGTAGWFTVLRPNTWFPASRLPQNRRIVTGGAHGTGEAAQPEPKISVLGAPDRHPIRIGLVALAAFAITSAMLLWIMHPR